MISVLVVDDDTDLLEMVAIVLRNSGMEVETLYAGSSLFNKLADKMPDIVVMDIYLGDTDGRHLCRQIKTSDEYSSLPVILYSAGIITPESVQSSGANQFLAKPFQIDQLINTIHDLTAA